ncbi:TIR domain-containing protein [Microbacterium sp. HJ5]
MKVFISWSGDQTRDLGHAVKQFLETAFAGHVETFLSDADVAPGERFLASINSQLDAADLGLLLVTRANQHAPWLLFESGALAGKTARGSVIPILIDIERAELDAPLNQFQNVLGTSWDSFSKLWDRVRADLGNTAGEAALRILLREAWPPLEAALRAAVSAGPAERDPHRNSDEVLAEILLGVNALVRRDAEASWRPPGTLRAESRRPTSVVDNSKLDLAIGQWITHDDFGDGVVEDLTGEGSKRVAHVDFERAGRKRLLVKIAPIHLAASSS